MKLKLLPTISIGRGALINIFLTVIVCFAAFIGVKAQPPQYAYANPAANSNNIYPFQTPTYNRVQWIYTPSQFTPALPAAGVITKVYFQAWTTNATNVSFTDLTIRMGPTALSAFPSTAWIPGVPIAYYAPTTVIPSVTPSGWIGLTLTNPIPFTNTSNFILDCSQTAYVTGFNIWHGALANIRLYGGVAAATATGISSGPSAFGFDILTTPCAGKPVAGIIAPVIPCPNTNFTLNLTGNTQGQIGLSYQWQSSLNGTTGWTNIIPSNSPSITQNINVPTYYRAILTCSNSNLSDTTPVRFVPLGTFYFCYCNTSQAANASFDDIGNVMLRKQPTGDTILNNGTATPLTNNPNANKTYTDFRITVPQTDLYLDSSYKISVTQTDLTSFFACTATAFIDYDHSATFDPLERIFTQTTSNGSTPPNQVDGIFTIPGTSLIGTTGMRVILAQGSNLTINPCAAYTYGETEDYLVYINHPPCKGPSNAGTAYSNATIICPGYTFYVGDTTYEKFRSGLTRDWQLSTDGGSSWTTIPNSTGKDTLSNLTIQVSTKYRVRMVCSFTNDTSYSNVLSENIGFPYQCYVYSQSNGGSTDSSDIGAFVLGNFIIAPPEPYTGGPHIMNPQAVRQRTDYTSRPPIILYADSTYHLSIYHILRSVGHADARVSVFMDYNNDLTYQPYFQPNSELVYSGVTTASNWYIDTMIRIPNAVVHDVPTGMRLILNNDVNPTAAANLGGGPFISGETEDYVVMFRRPSPTGVGSMGNLESLALYPNPTGGRFTVAFNAAKAVNHVDLIVTTIAGQQVMSRSYDNAGLQFTTDLDLSAQAKGIYFVEIKADGDKVTRKLVVK